MPFLNFILKLDAKGITRIYICDGVVNQRAPRSTCPLYIGTLITSIFLIRKWQVFENSFKSNFFWNIKFHLCTSLDLLASKVFLPALPIFLLAPPSLTVKTIISFKKIKINYKLNIFVARTPNNEIRYPGF